MKTKNVIIMILLAVVLGLSIQNILLIRKFDKIKTALCFEKVPVEMYIANLTQSLERVNHGYIKILSQHHWLSDRLDRCIETLEQQNDLEPIPAPRPYPSMPVPPNTGELPQKKPVAFYEPYQDPNTYSFDERERSVRHVICMMNLMSLSQSMYEYSGRPKIENFEKRLQRLNCYIEEKNP